MSPTLEFVALASGTPFTPSALAAFGVGPAPPPRRFHTSMTRPASAAASDTGLTASRRHPARDVIRHGLVGGRNAKH